MSTVTLLGLGAMGQRMAKNLLLAGHELQVWNRSKAPRQTLQEQGAQAFATPREAVKGADVVIAMLRDDEASRTAWLDDHSGALGGMVKGAIAIECSTLSLDWCGRLADAVVACGLDFLDAPVVGSRPQAEAGQLIHLVGGDAEALDRVRPILESIAGAIHHQGEHGRGMAMKLAVNALFGIQVAALGELLGFLGALGIDTRAAANLLGELPVTSPAAKGAAMAIASNSYAPMFPVELVQKDLIYAINAGPNDELPLTSTVLELFSKAVEYGFGSENIYAVAKLFKVNT
jgi:3-hydroxyisobutyrate dehydrogenase